MVMMITFILWCMMHKLPASKLYTQLIDMLVSFLFIYGMPYYLKRKARVPAQVHYLAEMEVATVNCRIRVIDSDGVEHSHISKHVALYYIF